MKKLLILFLITSTTITVAQKSVLLRLNYEKGDKYKTEMIMNQDMGKALMKMKMNMDFLVTDKVDTVYKTEMKFSYLEMNVVAEGVEKVNYNSNMKDEDLDEEGKKFRDQMKPMLDAVVFSNLSVFGENKVVKIEPNMPGVDKLSNQSSNTSVVYPKEEVKVGSSWVNTQSNQGMSMELTYTVKEINEDKVIVDMVGKMSVLPSAKIYGVAEIEKETGVALKINMNIDMNMMGVEMKNSIEAITYKE